MPKLIDADKLLEWLEQELEITNSPLAAQAVTWTIEEIKEGTFDPAPPVQPDTEEAIKDDKPKPSTL